MNIGNAVKELRKRRSLNQRELASACGLTQTSLSQIESGLKRPNPGTMKKLCDFFEVPEVAIYILATEPTDIPPQKQQLFDTFFPTIKNILIGLSDESQKLKK